MKFITTIQKQIASIALCAIVMTSGYSYGSNRTSLIKHSGSFILKIEQELSKFFNPDNKTPYNDYCNSLNKILIDFEAKIDQIIAACSDQDVLAKHAHDIAQEARKHFSAAYGIIKQYNGKKQDCAGRFVSDLNCVFSPDAAFNALLAKILVLHKEAIKDNDTELIEIIEQLIHILEKKKTEWNKKSQMTLLRGLSTRMAL